MIAAWMLFSVVTGLALTAGAAGAERLAAAGGLPRRFVWLAALLATAVWPAVAFVRVGVEWTGAGRTRFAASSALAVERLSAFAVSAQSSAAARRLDMALLAVWGTLAAVGVLRLLAGLRVVRRCRRAWPAAEVDGVPVRVSADVGPAVVGVRSMEVVLPDWALALDRPLRALVLRHEQEHRAAHDPYLLFAATCLTTLVPWHPALWWQARRLRLAVEVDCDARVLRAHPHRDRYALLLLAIAQRRGARALRIAPALSESTSHLDRRIAAMRTTAQPVSRPRAVVLAAASAAAVVAACSVVPPEQPVARAAERATSAPPRAFFEFRITRPATRRSGSAPRYPDALRAAHVSGQVIAQFVVDTAGRADMGTFKARASDDARFTAAVAEALAGWRFTPAEANGRKVKQLVRLPFQFAP